MKVSQQGNTVILEDIKHFNPKHIFECGQCFRWIKQEDDSYTGVAMGKVINVKQDGNKIYLDNTTKEDFDNIWYDYFDLGRDYEEMVNTLKVMDEYLEKATEFGEGIRILKQDGWEMLISFIISANNRIPMIQRAINNLSKNYGTYIGEYKGQEYYAFPTSEQLSKASVEEIRACSTGFRDKFNGVGPKVADCIALFGMQKYDTFPVDVWVKRVMQEFYVDEDLSLTKIRKFGIEKFGDLAGFAQQYLFYYAREFGIGR